MALDALALVPLMPGFSVTEPGENDDAFSETIGYKLWNKFVDWAHCEDLPLVVGAYAIHQKYTRVSERENGTLDIARSSVIVFMMGDEERSVCLDRVSKSARMLALTERIKRYSQEIVDGDVAPPPLPENADARLVPEDWFVERDTGTRPEPLGGDGGSGNVLIMPPASEEKKKMWSETGSKKRKTAEKSLQKFQKDYVAKQNQIATMLNEAVENVRNDEFDANAKLFKRLTTVTHEMKKKYRVMKKYEAAIEIAEDREVTEPNYPADEEEDGEDQEEEQSAEK